MGIPQAKQIDKPKEHLEIQVENELEVVPQNKSQKPRRTQSSKSSTKRERVMKKPHERLRRVEQTIIDQEAIQELKDIDNYDDIQDEINILDIQDGIIITKDDRFLKILEIEPTNFILKPEEAKANIITMYEEIFSHPSVSNVQIKATTRVANSERYMDILRERINAEDNPATRKLASEYATFIKSMSEQGALTRRFFVIIEYSFVKNNPVSSAMEKIVDELSQYGFEKEQRELQPFYESVRLRAEGLDNAQAKQKMIITLYDKFFSTGFKDTTERLGIVFTPLEVVDFIVKSVDVVLRKHFNKTLASENVHILDPFTGTGTFITRTLYYLKQLMDNGEITYADIIRKYTKELHANEIVLLSYYIAAINIEAVFDEINGDDPYVPFEGIVLTDTFESTEHQETLDDTFFGTNDKRLKRQQEKPITAIIGNPPYSIGQASENDNNQNISYTNLDKRLSDTYVKNSKSVTTKGLYDTYVKAFRWASDRLTNQGVIGFVTNGNYLNTNSADGLRAGLYEEFNHLYIFNLRGDQRTLGEQSRREGGKIFGSGSRTPVAISILVKDGSDNHELYYYDIGDYLSQKDKLDIISGFTDISQIE